MNEKEILSAIEENKAAIERTKAKIKNAKDKAENGLPEARQIWESTLPVMNKALTELIERGNKLKKRLSMLHDKKAEIVSSEKKHTREQPAEKPNPLPEKNEKKQKKDVPFELTNEDLLGLPNASDMSNTEGVQETQSDESERKYVNRDYKLFKSKEAFYYFIKLKGLIKSRIENFFDKKKIDERAIEDFLDDVKAILSECKLHVKTHVASDKVERVLYKTSYTASPKKGKSIIFYMNIDSVLAIFEQMKKEKGYLNQTEKT